MTKAAIPSPGTVTVADYARLRGVSHTAVQARIRAGALPTAAKKIGGRWIILDVDHANAEWEAHTRPRFGPRTGVGGASPSALADATLRERKARAWLIELDIAKRSGSLVPTREVDLFIAEMVVGAVTAMLGLPSRAKLRLPHLTASDLAVWTELIREALEGLANRPPWRRRAENRNQTDGTPHEPQTEAGAG